MVWTEIVAEDIGVTHVAGYQVVWPIGGDVSARRAEHVMDELRRREVRERQREQLRELANDIEQKQRARERLEAAGYDPEEIPL